MGVKKGYEYGDRVLAKKPRIGTLPVPNTFFKKNLTKNASWGTIDNCTLDRKDRETQQDFQDVFTINNNVYTSGLAQSIAMCIHTAIQREPQTQISERVLKTSTLTGRRGSLTL